MNNKDYFSEKIKYAEEVLGKFLKDSEDYTSILFEAMKYSVFAGGKRLRPVFIDAVYELCSAFDSSDEAVSEIAFQMKERFMASMEYLHTYSLVHDDLPAIDNDDYRRGRLTTHKQYGEANGVLAGDGLLHLAYENLSACFEEELYGDNIIALKRALRAYKIFADKTGTRGMLAGQAVDVLFTGSAPDKDRIDFVYRLKTCALLEGSFMIGAALAGASEEVISDFEQIGYKVGMAFQIKDDILDYTADEAELGKPVGSDEKNDKTTYVTLNGIEKAQEIVAMYSEEALKILDKYKAVAYEKGAADKYEFLLWLIESLVYRTH